MDSNLKRQRTTENDEKAIKEKLDMITILLFYLLKLV